MPLKGETVLEIFDVMLKAAYLGLTGVGMPLAVLAYLIYGSLKCGTRTGGLLFCGHLLVSVLAGGVVVFGLMCLLRQMLRLCGLAALLAEALPPGQGKL